MEEKQRRVAEAPFLKYKPNSPHDQLHDQPHTKRILVLLGANKSGKTYFSVNQMLAHSLGYFYWKVPGIGLDRRTRLPPHRNDIPPRYWVKNGAGVPITFPNTGMVITGLARERGIGQVIWPCIEELVPRSILSKSKVVKGPQGVATTIEFPWGSSIIFGSSDQDPLSFEGTRVQWAAVDEPVKPFVFNGLWRGLAVDHGRIWFTLTPLGADAAWMHKKWVASTPKEAAFVRVVQRDNRALTEDAIREFEESGEWTDAEKKARLYGEFESLGNRVLYNFSRSAHVVPARLLPNEWRHGMVVDPHHIRPAAVLWFKVDPASNTYHFYREWPNGTYVKLKTGGKTPAEYATIFRELEARDVPQFRVVDPRFGKAEAHYQGQFQTSWVDRMAECGMHFDARVPNVGRIEYGEQKIIDMFRFNPDYPVSPTNCPRIQIHDCCTNLIDACENYGILPQRDPTKGEPEKRSEEYKDHIDAMRYAVLYPLPASIGNTLDMYTDAEWEEENYEETWIRGAR